MRQHPTDVREVGGERRGTERCAYFTALTVAKQIITNSAIAARLRAVIMAATRESAWDMAGAWTELGWFAYLHSCGNV
jgi:hypothetical protein